MPIVPGSTPSGRRLRVVAAAVAVVALSGCGSTSFDAQTNAVYDQAIGTNVRGGGVDVLNALIVDNGDGTGTVSATLIFNPGEFDAGVDLPDQVTMDQFAVTTLDDKPIESTLVDGGVELEPNQAVKLGDEALATVSGNNFAAGDMVTMNVAFDEAAQPVELEMPVVSREDTEMYDEVAEAPAS